MRNLLSANFLRLKKSGLFWGTLALSFGYGAWVAMTQILQQAKYGIDDSPAFSRYTVLIGLVAAVFVSLFFGTEYSDGTIRNKLIAGQSRTSIYLTSLITASACGLLFSTAYLAACFAVGTPFLGSGLLGYLRMHPTSFCLTLVGIQVLVLAYCALFLFVTMNCAHKTTSAVICILTAFLLLFIGFRLHTRLNTAEFTPTYTLTDGREVKEDWKPNPQYLRGTERNVYQFLLDFTPGGQAVQYSGMAAGNLCLMPVYSLIILIVSTGAGVFLFRKKDLR